MAADEEKIKILLSEIITELDNETLEYFTSLLLSDSSITSSLDNLQENFQPFLDSYGIENSDIICEKLYNKLNEGI